jgi:7-carboxy-7-deazaguanine synthase
MSKLKVSEIFGPAGYWNLNVDGTKEFVSRYGVTQGEGKYVGTRSVFIRTFGCNFRCPSFGLEHGQVTNEPQEIFKKIDLYKNISEMPAAEFGCDSYFSVYPEFKDYSPRFSSEEVANMILVAAGGSINKNRVSPVHIIFTGGEPMLSGWQENYADVVQSVISMDPDWGDPKDKAKVTFETNGTQTIKDMDSFNRLGKIADVTWSVSPKLTVSGHTNKEALKPNVIYQYLKFSKDLYLKFVVQDIKDFDEVDLFVAEYKAMCKTDFLVYIMPEGGTVAEYQKHSTVEIAAEAVKRGYNVTPRLQVLIGANLTGW